MGRTSGRGSRPLEVQSLRALVRGNTVEADNFLMSTLLIFPLPLLVCFYYSQVTLPPPTSPAPSVKITSKLFLLLCAGMCGT